MDRSLNELGLGMGLESESESSSRLNNISSRSSPTKRRWSLLLLLTVAVPEVRVVSIETVAVSSVSLVSTTDRRCCRTSVARPPPTAAAHKTETRSPVIDRNDRDDVFEEEEEGVDVFILRMLSFL